MNSKFLARLKRLRGCTSGNATLLVALGMPMLIGGAGMGIDVAQWYMWKREIQYAADQAALAGAWARTDTSTEASYTTRATQEFNANISTTNGIDTVPSVTLANYASGTLNSVVVSVSASRELPFSSFLTGKAASIHAYAQASVTPGQTYTSCLIAVDPDASGAINIGGSSVLTASCGLAALSTSATSITVSGNPTVDAGWIVSAGGIDDWFKTHTDDVIQANLSGLYDPFKNLSPPNPTESQVARTYTCVKGKTTSKATDNSQVDTTYTYWKGSDPYNHPELLTVVNYNNRSPNTSNKSATYVVIDGVVTDGQTKTVTTVYWTKLNGSSINTTWEKKTVVTTETYNSVTSTTTADQATTLPGTYSGGIKVACQTTFATGVYVIDGGGLEIDGNYAVTGSGVMFVLKNGAYVKINGGTNINLTAIQASDLIARGVPASDANKLAGMLIFEDRNSTGSTKNNINGNASTVLNGTVYLPKSAIDFSGTATVTSQCLMIAASTINITGNANMSTFCPANQSENIVVGNAPSSVKLVA